MLNNKQTTAQTQHMKTLAQIQAILRDAEAAIEELDTRNAELENLKAKAARAIVNLRCFAQANSCHAVLNRDGDPSDARVQNARDAINEMGATEFEAVVAHCARVAKNVENDLNWEQAGHALRIARSHIAMRKGD